MKARCSHGAPWFADCPWCDITWDEAKKKSQAENIENQRKMELVKRLMDDALDNLFRKHY